MELHLKIIGILLIALAAIHIFFPKYFDWKKELKSLNLINQQMMIAHTFFVALVVFLMGLLCLTSAKEIIDTKLGKIISLGLSVFWSFRLIAQFFWYSIKLWKGKLLETTIHIFFSALWIYLSVTFLMNYLN